MHKFSKEQLQAAETNAKQSKQQGKEIEAFGKTIEANLDRATEAQGDSIEKAGRATQKHASASSEYAQEADETGSEKAFNQAVSEHFRERNEVLKAMKVYGEVVQNQGNQTEKPSDSNCEP